MRFAALLLISAASLAYVHPGASAQESGTAKQLRPTSFDESGKASVDGNTVSYLIRRLPLDSFPDLPEPIALVLNQRGCLIPQTYQAHHPENVIHASLDHPGSSDWAVLCSAHGNVDLLVFFARNGSKPVTLTSAPEVERLQRHDSSGVLGFDWGIDPATPDQVREAQAGMEHHPPKLDHDALAESVLNQRTVYHFYSHNAWTTVDVSD
jgi:hypothetical protein